MAGQIRITPNQMRSRASEFRTAGENFQEVISKMESLIGVLQEEWEGQASQGFARQFDSMKPTFTSVRDLIDDIGQQLDSTASAVEQLDQEIANKFNG